MCVRFDTVGGLGGARDTKAAALKGEGAATEPGAGTNLVA